MIRLLPVVEGDGDLTAVPELIRRVLHDQSRFDVKVCKPHKRGDLPTILGRFDNFYRTALLERAVILWVIDYDCATCDDPVRDLRMLKKKAAAVDASTAIEFVFMVKEYESLFLADHETTRKVFTDISPALEFPPNLESVRGAKEWLSKARPKGSSYKPTQHQQRLTAQLDLNRLRARSPSFQNFESALCRLIKSS